MSVDVQTIDALENEALRALDECSDLESLDKFHVDYLGRNGEIRQIFQSLDTLPEKERAEIGRRTNQLKDKLEQEYQNKKARLSETAPSQDEEWLDVTLPGRYPGEGSLHPVRLMLDEIVTLFNRMGFRTVHGPEVETEWYNFEALNIPEDHPARDMHDTYYLEDERLLRTHTSPVQIRTLETETPPVRIVVPGRVFRRDADRTHSPVFHQVEGLWVDQSITFTELKGVLELFIDRLFERNVKTRFRPSYFPFTEPSAEIDISLNKEGESEWLEILGAGMVDPAVFEAVDYSSESYQGFAFGMGVERLAMLKYGIDNLQTLFENDLRFLNQFSTVPPSP